MTAFAAVSRVKSAVALAALLVCAQAVPGAADARTIALQQRGEAEGGAARRFEQMPLDVEIGPSLGYHLFSDSDLRSTYQGLFVFGFEGSVGIGERTRFLLSAGYGRSTGNPYYDLPVFEGESTNELELFPVQAGLRANISQHPRLRVYLGAALVVAWARESVPEEIVGGALRTREFEGIGQGTRFTLSPEWRSASGGHSAGLELGFSFLHADLDAAGRRHGADLGDISLRLKMGWKL